MLKELYSETIRSFHINLMRRTILVLLRTSPLKKAYCVKAEDHDRIGVKVAPTDPDYWGLASVMTEEEAALTAHMKVRKPLTFEQLKSASELESEKLQQLLDDLSIKGIIEYNWENLDGKNPNHEKRYLLPMFVPGRGRHRHEPTAA